MTDTRSTPPDDPSAPLAFLIWLAIVAYWWLRLCR
jgi:hypothetical protein